MPDTTPNNQELDKTIDNLKQNFNNLSQNEEKFYQNYVELFLKIYTQEAQEVNEKAMILHELEQKFTLQDIKALHNAINSKIIAVKNNLNGQPEQENKITKLKGLKNRLDTSQHRLENAQEVATITLNETKEKIEQEFSEVKSNKKIDATTSKTITKKKAKKQKKPSIWKSFFKTLGNGLKWAKKNPIKAILGSVVTVVILISSPVAAVIGSLAIGGVAAYKTRATHKKAIEEYKNQIQQQNHKNDQQPGLGQGVEQNLGGGKQNHLNLKQSQSQRQPDKEKNYQVSWNYSFSNKKSTSQSKTQNNEAEGIRNQFNSGMGDKFTAGKTNTYYKIITRKKKLGCPNKCVNL